MKITMYELLGMVKDGKKLPKKVKVLDVIYEFDDHYGDYYNKSLDRYLFVYMTSEEEWKLAYFLNTQVEILEEETTVSEEQVLFNNLTTIDQEYVIRIMKMLQQPIDYLKSKGDE